MNKQEVPPTRLGVFMWANKIPVATLCRALDINLSFFSQLMWGHRSSKEVCLAVATYLDIPLELIYDGPLKRGRPKTKTE